jgi:hypothetical protein
MCLKDFFTKQAAEKRPSAALSGRLTVLAAWQKVAPYSSRRHPSSFVIATYPQYVAFLRISGALHLGIFE